MTEPTAPPAPAAPSPRAIRISLPKIVLALGFIGSIAFLVYVGFRVRDQNQLPMLSSGFAVLGACFAAAAIASLAAMWRAATYGRGGRAMGLAIVGGVAGLAAIGCFTLTVLLALVWSSG
jgi:hypothetical protein